MSRVTIIIPSKNELFLKQTILDVLEKAKGDIEVFPILDGYTLSEEEKVKDPRVTYFALLPQKYTQKRHAINLGVSLATGEYIMALDAHCMLAPGFDIQLIKDHQPNWVQVPRRHRLDAANWCLQTQSDNRPPIDYEYIMFAPIVRNKSLHGFKWDKKTLDRWDIPIDDIIEFQGSCWFMTKEWFNKCGFMQVEGYTGWGQEAEEISFTTWKNGGMCKVNKNTWYAHLHKGTTYGRMYWMSRDENRRSYEYSYKHWIIDNKEFMINLFEKFMPMRDWPENWREKIWIH